MTGLKVILPMLTDNEVPSAGRFSAGLEVGDTILVKNALDHSGYLSKSRNC